MSNIVKIKHGATPPNSENLDNFELGYAGSDKGLYTKNENDEIIHLNDTSAIEKDITDIKNSLENVSGIVVGTTEPENTGALWIDTNDDGSGNTSGIAKYYDENSSLWVEVAATWG